MNAGEVAMTEDFRTRVSPSQVCHQRVHCPDLCLGACVGRLVLRIQAALIADADAVSVVFRTGVCTHLRLPSPDVDASVAGHIVVISTPLPSE